MAYNTKNVITDASGKNPVPQYYSSPNDLFEVVQGQNGAVYMIAVGKSAQQPFNGSATTTKTFTKPMRCFFISNDGTADITITINGDTYTVKGGEVFDETFDPFTVVTVNTTVPFRAFGRG